MLAPSSDAAAHVAFEGVRFGYGDRPVLGDLSFAFAPGAISIILGGSGSGKSTILRLIGGLIRPQQGRITVAGRDVTQLSDHALFEVRKNLGMLFQGGALLDSWSVFDNVALPLREHTRRREAEIAAAVRAGLAAVGLSAEVERLLPSQLSGGMVKRVALARAMIMEPVILLCDEPLSGLDPLSAKRIETLLVDINRRRRTTVVMVSHSVASTMRMADRVLVLLPSGAVAGTPAELRSSRDPRLVAFFNEDVHESPEAEGEPSAIASGRSPG